MESGEQLIKATLQVKNFFKFGLASGIYFKNQKKQANSNNC